MSNLSELFNKDPLELTRIDLTTIVESMRSKRHLFITGQQTKAKAAAKPKKDGKPGLDLNMLDLSALDK